MSALSAILNFLFSPTTILFLLLVVIFYHFFITANNDFFAERGIPFIKPAPLFGNIFYFTLALEDLYSYYKRIWKQVGDVPFFGTFEFLAPVYVVKDADLARQILIKDFEYFTNHRITLDHENDPLFGRNLFSSKDQRWKDMRNVLSPAFTGSKMRILFKVINICAVQSIEQIPKVQDNKIEIKEFFTRITNDVIATAAFGVEINSIKNVNDFYLQARRMANFGVAESTKFILYSTIPNFMAFTGLRLIAKYKTQFLEDLVRAAISYREKTGYTRPDMIHLLLQAKHKGFIEDDEEPMDKNTKSKNTWTDDDIVAQCLLFFIAGFETASTLYVYLSYELAINATVQEKLRKEIDELNERLESEQLKYEDIMTMKYLDMVVSEALRKWPPNVALDRQVNKNYEMKARGMSVSLKRGDSVLIPTIAFHHDPQYFPNPEVFDPERFSDESKAKIHPAVYSPFGIGPRQCIGNRLALMQVKIFFYHLLSNYTIETNEKTEIPVKIRKGVFIVTPLNGLWLTFKPRKVG